MNDLPTAHLDPPQRDFQRLRELFERLSELPAEERDAEIARCTADAPQLAEELRALLEHAERTDSPLDNGALRLPDWDDLPIPDIPGFRLARRIGRGGSATVYLADQERADFKRVVALKVVDRFVDAASLRHVREEQRILARLEHPGIARLYDTGVTPVGQPYLAMELVEGESILEHCRSRQLPLRARLELFLSVLDAIVYAHSQAIVHRDLKPANILVSARGEAKLLDFGIAKLVANPGDDDETRTLQRAMTPAYASPEQIRGERITAASDIYSLGVVLYELLTGTLPFRPDGRLLTEVGDAFWERDLERPSDAFARTATTTDSTTAKDRLEFARWRRALRGDLDAVLLKALRRKPEARYASAAALADDLRRVLAGESVAARRGDRIYRTRKFLRRHRRVAAMVAVVLLLVAIQQMSKRWREVVSNRPSSEFTVYHEMASVNPEARRQLHEGAERLARFDSAGARDLFQLAVASSRGNAAGEALAWDGVARAQSALGDVGLAGEAARRAGLIARRARELPSDEAERIRARALAADRDWKAAIPAFEGLFGRQPGRVDIGLDLVSALLASGRTDEANNALGRLRQLRAEPGGPLGDPRIDLIEAEVAMRLQEYQGGAAAAARARNRAAALGAIALGLRAERIHAEALVRLDRGEEARRNLESVLARDLAAGMRGEAATARLALGTALMRTAGKEQAREVLEQALAELRAAKARPGEIIALVQLGSLAGMRGELDEAFRLSDQALAAAREIGDRSREGYVLSQRLVLLNWAGDQEGVMAIAEPTLAALRDSGNRLPLMATLTNLATSRIERLELDQAEAYLDEAEALTRKVGSQLSAGRIYRARGYLQQMRGDVDLARKSYDAALENARHAAVPLEIAQCLDNLAHLEVVADRPNEAAERAGEAITAFRNAGDLRSAARGEAVLVWVDARRGNRAAARRRLAALKQDSKATKYDILGAEADLAEQLGDWRRAMEIHRQAIRMASEWNAAAMIMHARLGEARALHGMGRRRELEKLVAELLPEVERLGLRGHARELRSFLASPATKR